MTTRAAEQQIRELAQNLAPVRPIPPLRAAAAAAVAMGLAALGVEWLLGGPGLRHSGTAAWLSPSYFAVLAGLVLMASGAIGSALAGAVPGRERSARLGTGTAVLGLTLSIAGGVWGLVHGGELTEDLWACLWCIGRALALGLAPMLLVCAFIVYSAVRRLGLGTARALAGGVALGAVAVHLTCPSESPLHWIAAHTLAPVVAVVVLAAPLAACLGRRTRQIFRIAPPHIKS